MKSVTRQKMKELDTRAIQEFGIPGLILMENAGRGVAELIFRTFRGRRAVVFSGKGNNGGDGFVIARHLVNTGFSVCIVLLERAENLKGDAAVNYGIAKRMGIRIEKCSALPSADAFKPYFERVDVIVDAIFGIGLNTEVAGVFRCAIEAVNTSGLSCISVDVPSGMDADTGRALGAAVKATVTATLGLPKAGLLTPEGSELAGKVAVIGISLPKSLLDSV